ncbi:MBL fold metallo-hydrolase [Maridesulfovibrio hydrothermalis]|uniref:Beta-lactamase domain protein n=1 Tax=Maridesulfovibrio hydrothermalis AM13 = DSM 14728 TaxID=1121451 RepID=L0RBE7_9BACT|nr:MBL fold hydrolase [Maridesulfovibrio hydrothermalis]CCO24113.1 Beta-lactamase domain protein [Maridesulfovibrio hydrothermalis AM13 = DSM 14728]
MYFKQLTTEGLGCYSYVIGCPAAGQMVVVDPKRDVQEYIDISREEGMKITHVINTHVHADHVGGEQELKSIAGAELFIHENAKVGYQHTPVAEGDTFTIGSAKLEFLYTPGHTPNAISILITDLMRGSEPWMILTGDLLFVGDVGRPDLPGDEILDEQVANLYDSLYVKLKELPDYLEVYPAHGQGSLCGKGMSAKPSTTLGYERRYNPMLQFQTFEAFKEKMLESFPTRPKSFTHIINTNFKGAPLLERCPLDRAMSPEKFKEMIHNGCTVIDVRDAAGFGGFHIPGSINIGLEKQLANWVGMAVEPDADLLLVVNSQEDYDRMCLELHRIGYDKIFGYLDGGISAWLLEGYPVESLAQKSAQELKQALAEGTKFTLLDVRTPVEWNAGHIEGAIHKPFGKALDEGIDVDKDSPVLVVCGSGYRSNIVGSSLQNNGYTQVCSLAGGTLALERSGFKLI